MNPSLTAAKNSEKPSPLREGDNMNRLEFERRFNDAPDIKKAELIEGRVYMASPVRHDRHARQHAQLNGWLCVYHAATPGVDIGDNSSWRIDDANEPQPDGLLRIEAAAGGSSMIDDEGYIEGTIEFAAEVAASSAAHDLGPKLRLYQRSSVQEYLVWRVEDAAIDWFMLREGAYVRRERDQDGVYRSQVLPGLWLDSAALLAGDLQQVFATLQIGLASQEHADFVARLQTTMKDAGQE
jgi:hypothetical protein